MALLPDFSYRQTEARAGSWTAAKVKNVLKQCENTEKPPNRSPFHSKLSTMYERVAE
jgi:hypothetical protein